MPTINELTEHIIRLGIEVHRVLGPGLPEVAYERAFSIELMAAKLVYGRQIGIPVFYKGELIAEYRPDFVVADQIVVELKAVERLHDVHTAQMLTYPESHRLRTGTDSELQRIQAGVRDQACRPTARRENPLEPSAPLRPLRFVRGWTGQSAAAIDPAVAIRAD
jgi:GxxExxY protein